MWELALLDQSIQIPEGPVDELSIARADPGHHIALVTPHPSHHDQREGVQHDLDEDLTADRILEQGTFE